MNDWNKMVFGFFKFIGIAFLVVIAITVIYFIISILIDKLKDKKEEAVHREAVAAHLETIVAHREAKTALREREANLRRELLQYDTTKVVIEIAYTALLKALAEKTENLSATPHYIENLMLDFRVSTHGGTVYLYSGSSCVEEINFYKNLHKENILKDNFENSTFSAVVAYMLICRLELEEFNGLKYDTVPTQKQISPDNEHELRDASIIIEIKNPNYAPPQNWKKTTPIA